MIKHTYLRYLLLIACFAPCASFATGTQTNCIQAVEQALRDEFNKFDQTIFDRDSIDDAIKNKMNTTLTNVMETADQCKDNDAKKLVNGHIINIDFKNHTFTFTIKVTARDSNNGYDGEDDAEENDEEHEYDDQTPAGYTSKYYLMFDKQTYSDKYANITNITFFDKTLPENHYELWDATCSQTNNPLSSRITDSSDLNTKLRANRSRIFGSETEYNQEYFLVLPHTALLHLDIYGILFKAPNWTQRTPIQYSNIQDARTARTNIKNALTDTSCVGLKIHILEERTNTSDNTKKIYIHPNPITIQ